MRKNTSRQLKDMHHM